ncbi:MAG: hypothetical protein RBR22_12135 [Desulfuromonas sp.]|nr:hypothetical protein [Desulfuromonas sp.]
MEILTSTGGSSIAATKQSSSISGVQEADSEKNSGAANITVAGDTVEISEEGYALSAAQTVAPASAGAEAEMEPAQGEDESAEAAPPEGAAPAGGGGAAESSSSSESDTSDLEEEISALEQELAALPAGDPTSAALQSEISALTAQLTQMQLS